MENLFCAVLKSLEIINICLHQSITSTDGNGQLKYNLSNGLNEHINKVPGKLGRL